MPDPRISKLAKLVVEYCVSIKPGDEVLLKAGVEAIPLIREIVKETVSKGGYPHIILSESGNCLLYTSPSPRD